jgi:hypothetical protein
MVYVQMAHVGAERQLLHDAIRCSKLDRALLRTRRDVPEEGSCSIIQVNWRKLQRRRAPFGSDLPLGGLKNVFALDRNPVGRAIPDHNIMSRCEVASRTA